ncbi:MAG TPA: hypothetical protein VF600_05625 [Abditibacteriaceae bacterium]
MNTRTATQQIIATDCLQPRSFLTALPAAAEFSRCAVAQSLAVSATIENMSRCLGVLAICIGLLSGCNLPDPCSNSIISQVASPDGQQKAVVFDRDCGATTGFSTQVSILPVGDALPNDGGNLFVIDDNHGAVPSAPTSSGPSVYVKWLSSTNLLIAYDKRGRTYGMDKQFGSVTISYKTLP